MSNSMTDNRLEIAHDLAIRSFRVMENWDDAEARAVFAPTMTNPEATVGPPAARVPGAAGMRGVHDWLHSAYADLHWSVERVVAEADWVAVWTTMSGRQVGPFVSYTPDGHVAQVFPPTGRSFRTMQTHWYRVADGQLAEHHAVRDDMGTAMQLGWFGAPDH
jgi:predicted ester cyclase